VDSTGTIFTSKFVKFGQLVQRQKKVTEIRIHTHTVISDLISLIIFLKEGSLTRIKLKA
jgi:hypothetical protein